MAVRKIGQLDLPDLLAGFLIEGNAAPVDRSDEDLAVADRDATAVGREQHLLGERIELRLIAPELLPCLRVERCHPIPGRDRIDHAVYHQGRFLNAHGDIAAMSDPCHRKLADIVLVDLIERTVTPRVGRPIVLWPIVGVFGARGFSKDDGCGAEQESQTQACR